MSKKKIFSLLLAAIMTMGVVSSCGGNDGSSSEGSSTDTQSSSAEGSEAAAETVEGVNLEGYPIVNDPMTVTMMGNKAAIHGEWDTLEFFDIMEEMTNISFEFDTPASEVLEEKKNLALNSGTYAEVMFGTNLSRDQQVKYGSQGILLPLEDLIEEYCPNIMACFEANPGFRESITAPDGHIYAMAQITTAPIALTGSMWVNKEWMDTLGIADEDLPTTVEGFQELLTRFRDEDPNGNGEQDEVPFVIFDDADKGMSLYNNMLPWFGVLSPSFYVDDDGVIHYGMIEENAKVGMEYIHNLYAEKLIDNDCFVTGAAEAQAKGAEGRVGSGFHALPRFVFGNMTIEKEATYPGIGAFSSEVNPERICTMGTGLSQGTFSLTDKCSEEVQVAMMRWVDYLYSEEGSWLIHYGPEGHIWEPSPNNPDMAVYIQPEDGRNTEEVRGGEITPDCGVACPKWVRPTTEGAWDDVQQQARIQWSEKNLNPYAKLVLPDMFFTTEEQAELDVLSTDLSKYMTENNAKFITGDQSFDEWDAYVQGYKDMGIDRMIEIYQTAYDRWAAAAE